MSVQFQHIAVKEKKKMKTDPVFPVFCLCSDCSDCSRPGAGPQHGSAHGAALHLEAAGGPDPALPPPVQERLPQLLQVQRHELWRPLDLCTVCISFCPSSCNALSLSSLSLLSRSCGFLLWLLFVCLCLFCTLSVCVCVCVLSLIHI